MNLFTEAKTLISENIRDYGMYIALIVIILIFTIMTDGLFISSRNISNLLDSAGYIAVLAVGVMLVIVIRHIDLSIGFLAGFLGAIAAILLMQMGLPVLVVIPIILTLGIVAGLLTGFLVAKVGIPAFVATLAGWLIYRGALLQVTEKSGTIIVQNSSFNAIGNGFIPSLAQVGGLHLLTLLLGGLGILFYVYSAISNRKNKITYKFDVVSKEIFAVQLVFVSAIIAYITWILAGYNGFSWTVMIMLLVVTRFN